jgi:hypothetical protein
VSLDAPVHSDRADSTVEDTIPDPDGRPADEILSDREDARALRAALRGLNGSGDLARAILDADLSVEEIRAALGIGRTDQWALARAREALGDLLDAPLVERRALAERLLELLASLRPQRGVRSTAASPEVDVE